ncbi:RNA polymerase factor sigma-70 RpoD [Gottschalkia acidurici 9a]|uniref:RNA polymerase factor sigma-70 RpoD n=1 Tax=Gottschalkia acidurici (strain ATCC 7906 / DSM 604 / BCRC 14475 / CIP 104303 / KCTC 5404 / NCIMB 10678 / 9a) TaxID=1128398 RepID=K0B430_GOTA9|nr:sigma-70 family RNA polymerase sigma factor [Gottschalkia acidurici]AFS79690.1 RNA polymerase factor sigma-70 RpoD [Gottschalkia acidurici 9a]
MHQATLFNNLNKEKVLDVQGHVKQEDFTYIFEVYYKRVYNYIYYRVNCHYTAEDLTSKVFEKIIIKKHTYSDKKSPFEVWVFAIARNAINDYFRSIKKHNLFSIDAIKELVSRKKTPEDIMVGLDTKDELLEALNTLDERDRNIVALKFGAELKNKEIADILHITESNVGVIIYRSMKKLKKEIEREG